MLWNPNFDIKGFINISLPGKLVFVSPLFFSLFLSFSLLLPLSFCRLKKVHEVASPLGPIEELQHHHRFNVLLSLNRWEAVRGKSYIFFSSRTKRHSKLKPLSPFKTLFFAMLKLNLFFNVCATVFQALSLQTCFSVSSGMGGGPEGKFFCGSVFLKEILLFICYQITWKSWNSVLEVMK